MPSLTGYVSDRWRQGRLVQPHVSMPSRTGYVSDQTHAIYHRINGFLCPLVRAMYLTLRYVGGGLHGGFYALVCGLCV